MSSSEDQRPESTRERWLAIDLRQLAALQALAKQQSFRGAAEELGYVQSAISQQLLALERVIGARLVERQRGSKPTGLTSAGELLLQHLATINQQLAGAKAAVDAFADGSGGELRLGVRSEIGTSVAPELVAGLLRHSPEISVVISELPGHEELLVALKEDCLDVALTASGPARAPGFEFERVLDDRFVLAVGKDSPLAVSERLEAVEDLAGTKLIAAGTATELKRLEAQIRRRRIRPGFSAVRVPVRSAIAMAEAGYGAFLSRLALGAAGDDLVTIELGDLLPRRTLNLVFAAEQGHSGRVARFRELAHVAAADLERRFAPSRAPIT